jgi:hypothetical protein
VKYVEASTSGWHASIAHGESPLDWRRPRRRSSDSKSLEQVAKVALSVFN